MLIVMKSDATDSQIEAVMGVIEALGFKGHPMPGNYFMMHRDHMVAAIQSAYRDGALKSL